MAFTPASFPETPPVTKNIDPAPPTSASTQSLVTFRDHSNICKLDMMRKRSCHWVSSKGIHTFLLLTAYNPEQRVSFRKLCWRKTTCVFLCLFLDSYALFCSMAYSPWLILYHVLWVQIQVELLPYLWQLILYFPVTYTFKNYKYVTNICLYFHQHRFFHINTQFFGKWKSSIPSKRIGSRSNFGPPFSA